MTRPTADIVKIDENNENLIGPSGMEILKKEIDGLEKFKKSHAESHTEKRYQSALRGLAYRWFEINCYEFNQLKPEQITALEILANQKTKKNFKILGWANIAFAAFVSIAGFFISPWILLVLMLLPLNILIVLEDLENDRVFRTMARKLNKKFDPKLLVETKKEKA